MLYWDPWYWRWLKPETENLPRVTLARFAYTEKGTYGRLSVGAFSCFTLELPWLNNEPFISCIPEGTYELERGWFKGRYENYALLGVAGRWAIEIHVGNEVADLSGCIALGRIPLGINDQWGVGDSTVAHDAFMEAMGGIKRAEIEVCREVYVGDYV